MAKKRHILIPLSTEEVAEVLRTARLFEMPVTAREIAQAVTLSRVVKETEVTPLLESGVTDGVLFPLPPKTAKGKPRYWGQNPDVAVESVMESAVLNATKPLSLKELLKAASGAIPVTPDQVSPLLAKLLAAKKLHLIPPLTSRGAPGYWREPPASWGREVIRQTVQSKGAQPDAKLRKLVTFLSDGEFSTLVDDLMSRRELFSHPPIGKVKKRLLATAPPRPEPYFQPVADQLKSAVTALRAVNVSEEQLRRSLVQLVESTGISFGATPQTATAVNTSEVTSQLEKLIRQTEPGAERGALVGIRDLRHAAALSKPEFDAALLELSRQGRLSLHRHDFPASLTAGERDELVCNNDGICYVGVALRQN
ncbi:MAG TPA: hypothetical protein VNQ76_23030 [Planctomicrobium sp.]|nr:hypothetical protein [Planctomicrobium sp.]